jgi:hypothetical protein
MDFQPFAIVPAVQAVLQGSNGLDTRSVAHLHLLKLGRIQRLDSITACFHFCLLFRVNPIVQSCESPDLPAELSLAFDPTIHGLENLVLKRSFCNSLTACFLESSPSKCGGYHQF